MSFDLKAFRVCPHVVVRERLALGSDLRTVRLSQPIARKKEVLVFVNGRNISSDNELLGWDLDTDELAKVTKKLKVVFKKQLKFQDPVIEVTFPTNRATCRRCHSQGFYFDYSFSVGREPIRIRNGQKLIQDMELIILTIRGSASINPWYGTSVVESIGGKNTAAVQAVLTREVLIAMEKIRDLQLQQARVQRVTKEEVLRSVRDVNVTTSPKRPTVLDLEVQVTSEAGKDEKLERAFFRLPV